ncbi:MAG: PDZ domain-containing protein, partial [Acidobacteriota bacterium]
MRQTVLVSALMVSVAVWGSPLSAQAGGQEPSWTERKDEEKQKSELDKEKRELRKEIREAERQMREAQREVEAAARKLAEIEAGRALRHVDRRVVVLDDHARLGVILRSERDESRAELGAVIEGLTPAGPAEEAGIKTGDIIVSCNGVSLLDGKADADEDESPAAARLAELVSSLKDGDEVKVEYLRGKEKRSATITARRLGGPRVRMFTR